MHVIVQVQHSYIVAMVLLLHHSFTTTVSMVLLYYSSSITMDTSVGCSVPIYMYM